MSIEAMKQALEALEYTTNLSRFLLNDEANIGPMLKADEAITSIRQAIAEAEKQEKQEKQKLLPRCFADYQPNHELDRKCEWCAVRTECQTGEAEKQEPVAKIVDCDLLGNPIVHFYKKGFLINELLYTHPQPAQPKGEA